MILDLLGVICDAESCADTDGYIGYCLDLARATGGLPFGQNLWLQITVNVAASYADSDEYYQFQLRGGTGTDGTDINAGAVVIMETPLIAGNDGRVDAAGDTILTCTLPYEAAGYRYLQLYYAQTGTTNTITIDAVITPSQPRTPDNVQVITSPVGLPS